MKLRLIIPESYIGSNLFFWRKVVNYEKLNLPPQDEKLKNVEEAPDLLRQIYFIGHNIKLLRDQAIEESKSA